MPNRRTRSFALSSLLLLVAHAPGQLAVGSVAPDIEFTDVLAAPGVQRLADLQGAAVLVEFWATWCGPCKAQIPHLRALHEKYAAQGLVIMAVSDEPLAKVQPFAEQNQMTYPIALAPKAMRDWGVRGIPTAFLIAPDGKIVWSGHPAALQDGTIEPHLAAAVSPLQRLTEQLAPAQDLLDLHHRGKALALLATLREGGKLAEASSQRAAKVEQALRRQVDALATRATQTKPAFARALLLLELTQEWQGQPAAQEARTALAELTKTDAHDVTAAEHARAALRHTARGESAAAITAWQKVAATESAEGRKRAETALAALRAPNPERDR